MDGVRLRADVLFSDHTGEPKNSVQKSSTKIIQKLLPALLRMLRPDEAVLYAAAARSPLSLIEQLTAAWWTSALAACAIVATNHRILFFPLKLDRTWRQSVRAVHWGDLQEVKRRGVLMPSMAFKFKDGTKVTYTGFRLRDAKKLALLASVLLAPSSGEQTAAQRAVSLCPDCCSVLTDGQYLCPHCGLTFKNERSMILRSILLPGGGYFYTGHPLIALLPAVVEGIFLFDIIVLLFTGLSSPNALPELTGTLLILAIFWGLETAITILHCRRYIREFIPETRDPNRVPRAAVPGLGG